MMQNNFYLHCRPQVSYSVLILLPCTCMRSRFMYLVASVCAYVTKKLTCLVPYRSKKTLLSVLYYSLVKLNISKVFFYVQQVVLTQSNSCLFCLGQPWNSYCILRYFMPNCYALCSSSARVTDAHAVVL